MKLRVIQSICSTVVPLYKSICIQRLDLMYQKKRLRSFCFWEAGLCCCSPPTSPDLLFLAALLCFLCHCNHYNHYNHYNYHYYTTTRHFVTVVFFLPLI